LALVGGPLVGFVTHTARNPTLVALVARRPVVQAPNVGLPLAPGAAHQLVELGRPQDEQLELIVPSGFRWSGMRQGCSNPGRRSCAQAVLLGHGQ